MSWLTGYLGKQPSDEASANNGANSRPRRAARVNYNEESEEEDLEAGLNFSGLNVVDSPLTSPGRPAQSPSISPRALLIEFSITALAIFKCVKANIFLVT